jgi:catechol 2,3-dioxygenase-like lactoylglutathione lyase family enzyme
MARLVGITHVALEVGDVDEALEWYGRFVEFELRRRAGTRMAFIDMGDQFIALSAGRTPSPDRARHFGLVVDDIQLAKTPAVLSGMNVGSLEKTDQALEELRRKGLAD